MQNKVTVFLQQRVLSSVSTIRVWVRQMLGAVQFDKFDNKSGFRTEQIHLHSSARLEQDREFCGQAKAAGSFAKGSCKAQSFD